MESKNQNIFQSDGTGSGGQPYEVVVKGKKYKLMSVFMTLPRSKERPMVLDISGAKNQSIFFGDEADSEKRYLYENGKVYWVPNIKVTN